MLGSRSPWRSRKIGRTTSKSLSQDLTFLSDRMNTRSSIQLSTSQTKLLFRSSTIHLVLQVFQIRYAEQTKERIFTYPDSKVINPFATYLRNKTRISHFPHKSSNLINPRKKQWNQSIKTTTYMPFDEDPTQSLCRTPLQNPTHLPTTKSETKLNKFQAEITNQNKH